MQKEIGGWTRKALISIFLLSTMGMAWAVEFRRKPIYAAPNISAPQIDREEKQLLTLINDYRQRKGLPALSLSLTLIRAADWFAHDTYSGTHTDSLDRGITKRVQAFGYPSWATEVLCNHSKGSAQAALDWWKTSKLGHNEELLRSDISAIGIGRAYRPPSAVYDWVWVVDLGPVLDTPAGGGPDEGLDALLLSAPAYIVRPGEVAQVTLEVKNTGIFPWQPDQGYALKAVGELPEDVPTVPPLQREVFHGEEATWLLCFPVTGGWGLRRYNFQMYLKDAPFGQKLTIHVLLLPKQLVDMKEQIQKRIDEWRGRGEKEIEELLQEIVRSIEEELQKRVESWFQEQLDKLVEFLSELCVGPMALLLGVVVFWAKQRR